MIKLFLCLALAVGGYWYWSGPYQQGGLTSDESLLEYNDKLMKTCMRKEDSMAGVAGMGGVGGIAGESEALCASQNELYQRDGRWHNKSADEY